MTDREPVGNGVSGPNSGLVFQAGNVSGDVHLHQHRHELTPGQFAQLTRSLTEVRQDLHQAGSDRSRLAALAVFLTQAIQQLQIQQDRLRDERASLLMTNSIQQIGGQITRAKRQRTRTTDELNRLTVLIEDLRNRLDALNARLPHPPAAPITADSTPVIAQTLNLDEAEAALDNVDNALRAASENSTRSRRRLDSVDARDIQEPVESTRVHAPANAADPAPVTRTSWRKASMLLAAPVVIAPVVVLLASNQTSPPQSDPVTTTPSSSISTPAKTLPTDTTAESPVSIAVVSPKPREMVDRTGSITIQVSNIGTGQVPWVYLRGVNVREVWPQHCIQRLNERDKFDCDVWYGHPEKSRKKQFQITAVVVDQEGSQALADLQSRNNGGGEAFDKDRPPTNALAKSGDVVVQRRD